MKATRNLDALGTRGAVYVEYLISFVPVFIMFLGVIQLSLMYAARVEVQHAANTAARAAIVVLDEDPQYYGGAPRLTLVNGAGGGGFGMPGGGGDKVTQLLSRLGISGGSIPGWSSAGSAMPGMANARYSDIRAAASIPLLAVSPSLEELVGERSIYQSIGGDQDDRAMAGATLYNRFAVAVTFPDRPGSNNFKTSFDERDRTVTTRVTYMFHCSIPFVSRFMCSDFGVLTGSGLSSMAASRALGSIAGGSNTRSIAARLTGEMGRGGANGAVELMLGADAPWLGFSTLGSGARFRIMRAEATLPLQVAPYQYPSEGG